MSAVNILEKASGHLKDRSDTYDKPDGERSIGATVQAFNAITGDGLMNSDERGWLFMAILKMVRSQQGNYKADNYEDLAAYSALMGEAACEERDGSWTPQEIEAAAFDTGIPVSAASKDAYKEYTLQEVLGYAAVPDWVRWVVVDDKGNVFGLELRPDYTLDEWGASGGTCIWMNKVVPPISSKNCIWEVNFKPACEYTLDYVIGDAVLSAFAQWVAVDEDGEVWEYSGEPYMYAHGWIDRGSKSESKCGYINKVVPPLNFKNCIWEIKN